LSEQAVSVPCKSGFCIYHYTTLILETSLILEQKTSFKTCLFHLFIFALLCSFSSFLCRWMR